VNQIRWARFNRSYSNSFVSSSPFPPALPISTGTWAKVQIPKGGGLAQGAICLNIMRQVPAQTAPMQTFPPRSRGLEG
jgi:hypothetical protein